MFEKLKSHYAAKPELRAGVKMTAFLAVAAGIPLGMNLLSQVFDPQDVATAIGGVVTMILAYSVYQLLLSREEYSQETRDMLRKHNDVY
jgi:cytosine/uracil/thiamine/allantoin permease